MVETLALRIEVRLFRGHYTITGVMTSEILYCNSFLNVKKPVELLKKHSDYTSDLRINSNEQLQLLKHRTVLIILIIFLYVLW